MDLNQKVCSTDEVVRQHANESDDQVNRHREPFNFAIVRETAGPKFDCAELTELRFIPAVAAERVPVDIFQEIGIRDFANISTPPMPRQFSDM